MEKLSPIDLIIEFPLHKEIRDKLEMEDNEFSLRGQMILNSSSDSRNKEYLLRKSLGLERQSEDSLTPGTLYGSAILHTAYRYMLRRYSRDLLPQLWSSLDRNLRQRYSMQDLELLYKEILTSYPSNPLYHGRIRPELIIHDPEKGEQWTQLALEQILLLRLAGENSALAPVIKIISPSDWEQRPLYKELTDRIEEFLSDLPQFGPEQKILPRLLRCPMEHSPDLTGQLKYISDNWGEWLEGLLPMLLEGIDLLSEENQIRIPGPGPAEGVDFSLLEEDHARYSPDSSWMPRVILLAKNALVWLFQLSKKYGRPIENLAEIPDEELDFLNHCGFTGLWLIGLWERSPASREIKKRCGNPEAEASAYSLLNYRISHRLGGDEALLDLKARCSNRGIHLASDMVPNHTGMDSEWVQQHPEWFISRPDCPYPQYSYNGENLSSSDEIELYIEDHYYNRSDCAVTFKRVDRTKGQTSYIYHGNDGTSMPWNDTAQIDFLNAEAREAVIQQILNVARNFPIIRFDAAMVLARKHVRRLWYPRPGEGGAVPSRSDSSMTDKEFFEAMPEEFWREVVQRVARECPDTLLLAEAFWMMEGYFVRNLGMHRVYNSAFMNMVKEEKNREFRIEIKKTLDYDPEILKRYVNFMSNPDEDTAESQFGRGDKYFGVFAMMLTLPGLPMVGHGQLEGFREKYGMEYSRSYYDETPDEDLMERHEREIYPIMKQRQLFSDAAFFHLYDGVNQGGSVEESLYAYSNIYLNNFTLFLFNNRMEQVAGRIKQVYGKSYGLAEALGLGVKCHQGSFVIFREHCSGLWFIRRCRDIREQGLYVQLSGYEYQLFTRFQTLDDTADRVYEALYNDLNGRGTPSIEQAVQDYRLKPLYKILATYFNTELLQSLTDQLMRKETSLPCFLKNKKELNQWFRRLAGRLRVSLPRNMGNRFRKQVKRALRCWRSFYHFHLQDFPSELIAREETAQVMALWLYLKIFREMTGLTEEELLKQWDILRQLDLRRKSTGFNALPFNASELIGGLSRFQHWFDDKDPLKTLGSLFDDPQFCRICGVNQYDQILWFNKQGFEMATTGLFVLARFSLQEKPLRLLFRASRLWKTLKFWVKTYEESQFRVQHMHNLHLR